MGTQINAEKPYGKAELEQYKETEIYILNLYGGLGNSYGTLSFDHLFSWSVRNKGIKKLVINIPENSEQFRIDSIGMGRIISLTTSIINGGGKVRCSNIHGKCERMFKITKLDTIFQIHPTLEEAVQAFSEE